jgi:hypothetical protein
MDGSRLAMHYTEKKHDNFNQQRIRERESQSVRLHLNVTISLHCICCHLCSLLLAKLLTLLETSNKTTVASQERELTSNKQ